MRDNDDETFAVYLTSFFFAHSYHKTQHRAQLDFISNPYRRPMSSRKRKEERREKSNEIIVSGKNLYDSQTLIAIR